METTKRIQISVKDKVACLVNANDFLVCKNSDYEIEFLFDEQWADVGEKVALFVFGKNSKKIGFNGNVVSGIPITNASVCLVGVVSGNIASTTPAQIKCLPSIDDEAQDTEDYKYAEPLYAQLMEEISKQSEKIEKLSFEKFDYDMVIFSDDEFDKCLYPLYKNEDTITKAEAAKNVANDSYFNEPDPTFKAKSVLVKGVTFKKMRGYDDVRLHIFQPSIEYIKFENCRWETHWKVSGKNPRDTSAMYCNLNTAPERATAFNRATDPLTLTIEGLHITEGNTSAARVSDQWGVGLRNIKALKNCYIDYPKNYKLAPEGYAALEMSCQFFDFADNCSISGLWDGTNVVNCKISKILKRCSNVANLKAVNLFNQNGNIVPIKVLSCVNMVNIKGTVAFEDNSTPTCEGNVAATREEAQGYATTAEKNATDVANTKVPIGTPSSFSDGAMVYAQLPNGNIVFVHARTGYNRNEIVMRDNNLLTYARPSDYNQKIEDYYDNASAACGKWPKGALVPRDYVDKLVKGDTYGNNGYAPLNKSKKIDDRYLPSYAPLVDGKVPTEYIPSSPSSASPYDIIITSEEQFVAERYKFYGKKILVKHVKFTLAEIDFNNAAYIEFCNVYVGNENSFLTIKNFKIGNFSTLFRGWNDGIYTYYCDNLYIENFSFAENLIPYDSGIHGSGDIIEYKNGYGIMNCAISAATNCCNITNCHAIGRNGIKFTNCTTITNLHAKNGYDFYAHVTFDNCTHLSNLSFPDYNVTYNNCSKVSADTCDGYIG